MKRSTTAGLAVAGATLVLLLTLRACTPDNEANRPEPIGTPAGTGVPSRPVGPTRVIRGVPGGWRRDGEGARAAAISAVHLTGPIAKAGFITRSDMIAELSTERFGPTLTRRSATQLDDLMSQVGSAKLSPAELLWEELPLTSTVTHAGTTGAKVRVWSVIVAGAPGVGVPRQAWRTVTVDLAWERGDWKVAAWSDDAGPTPVLVDTVEGSSLDAVREVSSWLPVSGPGDR